MTAITRGSGRMAGLDLGFRTPEPLLRGGAHGTDEAPFLALSRIPGEPLKADALKDARVAGAVAAQYAALLSGLARAGAGETVSAVLRQEPEGRWVGERSSNPLLRSWEGILGAGPVCFLRRRLPVSATGRYGIPGPVACEGRKPDILLPRSDRHPGRGRVWAGRRGVRSTDERGQGR